MGIAIDRRRYSSLPRVCDALSPHRALRGGHRASTVLYGSVYTQYCVRAFSTEQEPQNRIFAKNNILKIWLGELGEDTTATASEMVFLDYKPLFCLIKVELATF